MTEEKQTNVCEYDGYSIPEYDSSLTEKERDSLRHQIDEEFEALCRRIEETHGVKLNRI